MSYTFTIFKTASALPKNWDHIVGKNNVMLSQAYFQALDHSAPENMNCVYAGFLFNDELVGGALFQFLNFSEHKTFQKNETTCNLRNWGAKKFSRSIMIVGNNMLTGQNGFYFDSDKISAEDILKLLQSAATFLQKNHAKTSLIIFKDYSRDFVKKFDTDDFKSYFRFSVQPNMILNLKPGWKNFDDYVNDFSKKYRLRAKTARKKSVEIQKSELNLEQLESYKNGMNLLYQNVAENAPFNTFFLNENHFIELKKSLQDKFVVFGYFLDEKLIGFCTVILNGEDVDTYFLGYEKSIQKEKQLYMNMLLDMTEFSIDHRFTRIIFGRTALEIKSTVGAEPSEIFGLIKHQNQMINPFMKKIFTAINPQPEWIQRKPFK
ncbi:hypothetical protein ASG01_13145 [Chryseobacterium sp. Leaf180]|uniref:peptidogalycan biosysnthesis protein n=1 Tax=Chryseobacterium sp. Leaf180 TaxID=1736289 RepID=UPI0006F3EAA2|nr:peptidogalycan biosysnthesis protein [Chryseobacterium sp. Leaf180]KQR91942.1 hypothetical protein ASG01_13145 [Chryseobacterium sp. Leaf180]